MEQYTIDYIDEKISRLTFDISQDFYQRTQIKEKLIMDTLIAIGYDINESVDFTLEYLNIAFLYQDKKDLLHTYRLQYDYNYELYIDELTRKLVDILNQTIIKI